jgi:putative ABC transport system permease protein
MNIELILTGILQGLVLAFVAYGVMIPFRLLNFPDLTAEGAYPLGGAVSASLIILGIHPVIAILLGAIGGGLAGMATAYIHLRFRVNTLLAGIILSTMLYSVNLRLMGKPNIALFNQSTLFPNDNILLRILIVLCMLGVFIIPLLLFLRTNLGLRFRAVGFNPEFAKRHGISITRWTIFGLFLGNAYTGLAGGLMVQTQSYADIGMGVGIVIHALAALMIGECIVGTSNLHKQLLAPLVGALIYQQIQGLALSLGLAPSDLKLLTGGIVLGVIALKGKYFEYAR